MIEKERFTRHRSTGRGAAPRLAALLGLLLTGLSPPVRPAPGAEPSTADTGRVFGSWEEWERAHGELAAAIEAFEALAASIEDEPIQDAVRLVAVMRARDRVYRIARRVEGFLYLELQLDAGNEEARSRQHLTDETDRRWSAVGLPWLTRTLTELGRERIEAWTRGEEALAPYAFFFRRLFDRAAHPYPEGGEALEALRALADLFGRQSTRLYRAIAIAEAPAVEVGLASGERLELSPARARTLPWELSNARDRGAVSRAWLEALGERSQSYAALLEGIVGRRKVLAEVRGFGSALEAALHADAIPAGAIRGAIRTAREGSAPLRRYHALRKRLLGLEAYGLADRFFPLEPDGGEISFERAEGLVVGAAAMLGAEVQDLVRRAFSEGWIDAVERPGKRAHGGATFVAGEAYVLVSYRGSLDSLFQLTHEIGHAVHSHLADRAQPFVTNHPSTLTAETVAGVFEGALVEHLIAGASGRREKLRRLDLSIQNLLRLFYRPMLDADFELRLYERSGPITGPALGTLYREVVGDFYGPTLHWNEWDRYGWQLVPHHYTSPLYLGRYGLASAAANALVARLTSASGPEREGAREAFLELMRAGGSAYPAELLARAGADLEDPGTTHALVARLDSLVAELEYLANGG